MKHAVMRTALLTLEKPLTAAVRRLSMRLSRAGQ
jgi:hypothetical protein